MIDPTNMTLPEWADAVILSIGDFWAFGRLDDEAHWQDWGANLIRASGFTQRNPPDPYQFTDWRDWAMRIYPMLEATVQ